MRQEIFSTKEIFKKAWESWKQNWRVWTGAVAITFLLSSIGNLGVFFKDSSVVDAIFQVLGTVLGVYATLCIIHLALRTARGLDIRIKDYFNTFSYFLRYFCGQVLYFLAISIGLVLFIVPGIIVGLMFYLFPYYILEKNMGVIEAFKASKMAVAGVKGKLFLFAVLSMLINVIGFLCLFIGLFISIPVVAIAQAMLYTILHSQLEERSLQPL